MSTVPQDGEKLRGAVRERYGRAALQVTETTSQRQLLWSRLL